MDPFSPAPRELTRKLFRQSRRVAMWRLQRALNQAETDLGLLGWQQADFDSETQRQVLEIQHVEREQTRLYNLAAEKGAELRKFQATHAEEERQYQAQRQQVEAELQKLRAPRAQLQKALEEKQKQEPAFLRRLPELDRELREVNKLYAELLAAEKETPQIRQELVRLRERTVSIPNEKNDLRTQHLRVVSEVRALETELEDLERNIATQEAELKTLQRTWEKQDAEFKETVRGWEQERAILERRALELEEAKTNPYQQIGKVLAIAGVAPMNQPEALEKVKQLQFQQGELQQALLESAQQSAQEPKRDLHCSYGFWGTVVILVLALVVMALRG